MDREEMQKEVEARVEQDLKEGAGAGAVQECLWGEVFQQIVWNFTVCVGYWGYKDKDALNLKERIHFRGLPQSLAYWV